jgi:hypothetical protein
MRVKRSSGHGAADVEAKRGLVSSTVVLVARAAKGRASYDGQDGRDAITWIDVDATLRAGAAISGLTPGASYFSRLGVLTPAGKGDRFDAFSLLVA